MNRPIHRKAEAPRPEVQDVLMSIAEADMAKLFGAKYNSLMRNLASQQA